MSKIISLLLAFWLSFGIGIPVEDGSRIYVDGVAGSDSADGTKDNPVQTISHALELVNDARKTVFVLRGTFCETVSVSVPGVTIEGRPYANVTIHGGDPVQSQWERYKGFIYKTKVDTPVESVFVNGAQMNLARWPNTSVSKLVHMRRSKTEAGTNETTLVDSHLPNVDLIGARLNIWPGSEWTSFSRIISDCVPGKELHWETPIRSSTDDNPEGMDCYVPLKNNPYYVCDALTLLDYPGEWYYDSGEQMLYLYAPGGKNPGQCDVSVKARGYGVIVNADDVTLRNISLFGCGLTCTGSECVLNAVDIRCSDFFVNANYFDNGDHVRVLLGGSDNVWKNSIISDTWGNGITVNGTRNVVENCIIHDVDYAGGYYGCVVEYGSDNIVRDCTFYNSGRYLVQHNGTHFSMTGCDCSKSALLSRDCGATYTWGTDGQGAEIAGNYVHDNREVGVYLDNNCRNYYVHDNYIVRNDIGIILNSRLLNCTIEDNALLGNDRTSTTYFYEKDGPSMEGSVIRDNVYTGKWMLVTGEYAPLFENNTKVLTGAFVLPPERHYGASLPMLRLLMHK